MKFSVIMPVYGVEKYLKTAVESVVKQTFSDFELILVDDCSPDGCPALCDELAKTDERIKVIHKPQNEGLGFARNTGLAAAEGEYVYFLDSDDYIADTLLEKAYTAAEGADIVTFGVMSEYRNKEGEVIRTETLTPPVYKATTPAEVGEAFVGLNRARVFQYAWNKIYRRAFLNECGILFESTALMEDFLFNIAVFDKAQNVCGVDDTLYFYQHNVRETLANKYSPEFFSLCKRKYALEKAFLQNKGVYTEENAGQIMSGYVKHLISAFMRNAAPKAGLSFKGQCALIKEMLNDETTRTVLRDFKAGGVMKVVCLLLKARMVFCCWLMAKVATKAR